MALPCPCGNWKGSPHVAELDLEEKQWICSKHRDECGDLSDSHLIWKNAESGGHATIKADSVPKMPQITSFPVVQDGEERNINLVEKISTKYPEFGTLILEDENGSKISSLKGKCRDNPHEINRQIFADWLAGEGLQPVTWKTLIGVLGDIGMSTLASKIEANIEKY